MLTKKQLTILEPFLNNVFKECSYKELKALSQENSNNAMQLAVQKFKEEGLIKERKIGTSHLYSIDLDNEAVFHYFSLIALQKLPPQTWKIRRRLREAVEKVTSFYSVVVLGSYAAQKHTKTSDLDMAVFIEDPKNKNKIEAAIKTVKDTSLIDLDIHVITQDEFLEMLLADYENLGKEIARKHVAIYNAPIFYALLRKGVNRGFKL